MGNETLGDAVWKTTFGRTVSNVDETAEMDMMLPRIYSTPGMGYRGAQRSRT